MEVVPDPSSTKLSTAAFWFRSNVPAGFRYKETTRCIMDKKTNYWIVTYTPKTSAKDVRPTFQRFFDGKLKVTTIQQIETMTHFEWLVSMKKIEPRNSLWNYIIPCMVFQNKNLPDVTNTAALQQGHTAVIPKDKQRQVNKKAVVDLTKLKPKDCQIVCHDNISRDLSETVIAKKLVYAGKNITRKVFGKTRMNNHFKKVLLQGIDRPLIWSKVKAKQVLFHTATPSKDERKPAKTSQLLTNTSNSLGRCTIPCDYTKLENSYRLSKLKNSRIFKTVNEFLALKGHQPKNRVVIPWRKNVSVVGMANDILADGLPVDELLDNLFLHYCREAGITSNEIETERERIRAYYGACS